MYIDTDLPVEAVQPEEILPPPALEMTPEEEIREFKAPPQQGDVVTISEDARALAAAEESGEGNQLAGEYAGERGDMNDNNLPFHARGYGRSGEYL